MGLHVFSQSNNARFYPSFVADAQCKRVLSPQVNSTGCDDIKEQESIPIGHQPPLTTICAL